MRIRGLRGLAETVKKLTGERLGLRGNFGRMPERRRYELRQDEIARVCMAVGKAKTFRRVLGAQAARHEQFSADVVWRDIARERQIDVSSIQPDAEKGFPYFTAVPLPDDERNQDGILVQPVGPR